MSTDPLFSMRPSLPVFDEASARQCRDHWDSLAKPLDGLGDLEEAVIRLGAVQKTHLPTLSNPRLLVFLSDNGIVEEGVSQCDPSVTRSVAEAMARGASTVCHMARRANIPVHPLDVGICGAPVPGIPLFRVRDGSRNFLRESAMTPEETQKAIRVGYDAAYSLFRDGCDALLLGEMGIGNTSSATALSCALLDMDPGEVVGRGAGLSSAQLTHKSQVLRQALHFHASSVQDPFRALCALGGYDIAGMIGAILACGREHVPVILDGLITLCAALTAEALCPSIRHACLGSHFPRERMGRHILSHLDLFTPLHANMALGEGTGAVLIVPLLQVALALYHEGTTFEELGIPPYQRHS